MSDRRSTFGFCTFIGGNLVTWRSRKQNVVARSSVEAEFKATAQGICELICLKILLSELRVVTSETMKLYSNNKAAINIANNPVHHDRTKHVKLTNILSRRRYLIENIESGEICITFVTSGNQLADILTKRIDSAYVSFMH